MQHVFLTLSSTSVPGTVLTNTLLVAVVALTHVLFATFLIGSCTLVALSEGISMVTKDERHERLARSLVHAWGYVFSTGAALAIFFVVFVLVGMWGRFFVTFQQFTFWVWFFEALLFVGEIVLLYTLYANWERLRAYRRARLGMVMLLNIDQWFQMFLIDVIASQMLTPTVQGATDNVGYVLQFLNPTNLPLTVHRTIGNIAWAGAIVAVVSAFQYLRVTRREEALALAAGRRSPVRALGAMPEGELVRERNREAAYWDWAGQWGMLFAFGLTIIQIWVGYSYAKEIQLHSLDSWYQMMYGWISNIFLAQFAGLGLIFIFGVAYFWQRLKAAGQHAVARRHQMLLGLLILLWLFGIQPAWFAGSYPDIVAAHLDKPFWQGGLEDPFGFFFPWKVMVLLADMMIALYALWSYIRARVRTPMTMGQATRGSQRLLIAMAVVVGLMMLIMGVIRESSRSPYLVNQNITISHQVILQQPAPDIPLNQRPIGP
jgi:cytochrome d ubiquinol oxidase subunit I